MTRVPFGIITSGPFHLNSVVMSSHPNAAMKIVSDIYMDDFISGEQKFQNPLRFIIVPYVLQTRILLQELRQIKIDWDDFIYQEAIVRFQKWLKQLQFIPEIKITRCYFESNLQIRTLEIHCFVDASLKAYGCAVYLRFQTGNGYWKATLIGSKSRVVPLKKANTLDWTIPRLELVAAVTGVRYTSAI